MATSEDQLKRAADLKLWLESRISDLQEETARLREALAVVDGVLRASSFRPATEVSPASKEMGAEIPEIRELRRDKGGETIATAEVTRGKVVVEPAAEVILKPDTPPFKSFLMGKILTGMKAKDDELVAKGKLKKEDGLRFAVNEKGGKIGSLTIENYREKERLNEILNTVGWTFSRMLEKQPTSSR
jgi:hypothetical protein